MLFMVIEKFRNQDGKAVYRKLRDSGRSLPDGLKFVASYVSADLGRCFQLMETDDPALLGIWRSRWSDLVDFEVFPVVSSAAAARQARSDSNNPDAASDRSAAAKAGPEPEPAPDLLDFRERAAFGGSLLNSTWR